MIKSLRKSVLYCVVATLALAPFQLTAQEEAAEEQEEAAGEESSEEQEGAVEEQEEFMAVITVTAQKREENVQDVPLSITAISGDRLNDGGVLDVSRIKLLTPGMNFGQTGANAHLAIRGARTEGILFNVNPVISTYNDNIYRSGTSQAFSPLVDMNRVEILRGPQGTLFGRNSYGGAINFITNRPVGGSDFGFAVTAGDYSRSDIEGFANAGGDRAKFRLAFAHREHDGYVINTFDRSNDILDQDEDYFRGQLLLEPSDKVSILFRGEYWKQGGNGSADFNYFTPGSPENDSVFGAVLPINVIGGGQVDDPNNPYSIARDADFILDAEQQTYSVELDWDLGFANMKILLAETDYYNFHTNDPDMGPIRSGREGQFDDLNTRQQEIHFTDNGEGSLSWLVGAFFLQEDARDSFFYDCQAANPGDYQCYFANKRDKTTDAVAGFAQVTMPFMDDNLRVTAGVRFSDEDRTFRVVSQFASTYYPFPYPVGDPHPAPANLLDTTFDPATDRIFVVVDNEKAKDDPVTYRLAVDYRGSENHMVYGSVSTGYSLSGFNATPNLLNGALSFRDQNVTAYEIGTKNTLLGGRMILNLAAFYNDFKQILNEPGTFIGAVIIYNDIGGDGSASGIDLELDWNPASPLLVNVRASLLNARYGTFVTGTGVGLTQGNIVLPTFDGGQIAYVDVSGLQIAFSPDFTLGIGAQYPFALGQSGSLTPSVDFYYTSDYFTADQHYPFSLQDSYTQTDLRLTWRSQDSPWSVQGFVQNLEDEAVILRTNIFNTLGVGGQIGRTYAAPQIYGLRLAYNY